MSWKPLFNIAKRPIGDVRSITGYGAESLITGRALICGYNLFFKAWRDLKYDAVLEADKILFRVEFKGTSTKDLTLTSGSRAGKQINRAVDSREQVLSTDDSEILIGIDSACGICWVIPTEIIKILKKKRIPIAQINHFKEKWGLMRHLASEPDICRKILAYGISGLSEAEQKQVEQAYGKGAKSGCAENPFEIGKNKFTGVIRRVLNLWKLIYDHAD